MPPDGYTTLTLPEDAAQRLEDLRGDETVGEFVHALADAYEAENGGEPNVDPFDAPTSDGAVAKSDDLESLRDDLLAQIPSETARELEERVLR